MKCHVYRSRDGWRWRLKSPNGRIVACGEGHTRKADAIRAWKAVHAGVRKGVKVECDA